MAISLTLLNIEHKIARTLYLVTPTRVFALCTTYPPRTVFGLFISTTQYYGTDTRPV